MKTFKEIQEENTKLQKEETDYIKLPFKKLKEFHDGVVLEVKKVREINSMYGREIVLDTDDYTVALPSFYLYMDGECIEQLNANAPFTITKTTNNKGYARIK